MQPSSRSLLLLAATALGLVGCSGGGGGATASDLVGTWRGEYRFATGTADALNSEETLVIERADGELLWGYDEYVEGGKRIRIPVRGSVGASGETFALAEEHGFFLGEVVDGDTVLVRFVRTDDQFTSFEAELRRQ